jgi:DNA protecting protein DprA
MKPDIGQDALPFEANGQHRRPEETPSFVVTLLALNGVEGLGRKGLRQLVSSYGDDLGGVWSSGKDRVRGILGAAGTRSADKIATQLSGETQKLLEEGRRRAGELAKNRVFTLAPSEIPRRLREIPDGPLWLFVQGDDEVLHHRPAVAVVGTRQASARGREAAGIVAHLLAAYPITLVSGLAEGIDEEAHAASLEEGADNVAFLGYGLKHVFPAITKGIRRRIANGGGALATEYFFDERYHRSYFVERNRLQAALADVVIPVEAEPKSGTAHTVRFARQYGRRLVGITWPGAPGMAAELEQGGDEVLEVFERRGRERLDAIFRQLAEENGHETFALSLAARRLDRELRARKVPPKDVDRFLSLLKSHARNAQSDDAP